MDSTGAAGCRLANAPVEAGEAAPGPATPAGTAMSRSFEGARDIEQWRHAVSTTFETLEPVVDADGPFHAVLDATTLGELSLLSVQASPHMVVRTAVATGTADRPVYKITLQVAGVTVLDQDGHECLLQPGDLVLSDTGRPYRHSSRDDFHLAVLIFPRDLVPLPPALVERWTARVLPSREGAGAVLNACMRSLLAHAQSCGTGASHRLAAACMDLLAATLADTTDNSATTPADARRLQIIAWIREHLTDDALCPDAIAAAHHISPRYLHRLFEDQQISVSAYIRAQRLERVKADLESRLLARHSINAIADRWGFHNQPHLTRLFRERYGLTPGEVRRRALNPDST